MGWDSIHNWSWRWGERGLARPPPDPSPFPSSTDKSHQAPGPELPLHFSPPLPSYSPPITPNWGNPSPLSSQAHPSPEARSLPLKWSAWGFVSKIMGRTRREDHLSEPGPSCLDVSVHGDNCRGREADGRILFLFHSPRFLVFGVFFFKFPVAANWGWCGQKMVQPSGQQPLQPPTAVHPEGIQDGAKQDAGPR